MIFKMQSCGGCKTCAIACSFKHTGEFNPAVSSIKILEKEDGLGFYVCLVDQTGTEDFVCDGCIEMDEPTCVQFCEKSDDLKNILNEYVNETRLKKECK